jgi:hypothetical protein
LKEAEVRRPNRYQPLKHWNRFPQVVARLTRSCRRPLSTAENEEVVAVRSKEPESRSLGIHFSMCRVSAPGHEEPCLPRLLDVRFVFRNPTFAATSGNDADAPKADRYLRQHSADDIRRHLRGPLKIGGAVETVNRPHDRGVRGGIVKAERRACRSSGPGLATRERVRDR